MKIQISASILSLLLCGTMIGQEPVPQGAFSRRQEPKTVITADELNSRYVVHGSLGVPLGKLVTIEAEATKGIYKGNFDTLRVTRVDGKQLKKPVEVEYFLFVASDIEKLEPHTMYQLRVYETGNFDGIPLQAMEESGPVQTRGYAFRTTLKVVRALETKGKAPPKNRVIGIGAVPGELETTKQALPQQRR